MPINALSGAGGYSPVLRTSPQPSAQAPQLDVGNAGGASTPPTDTGAGLSSLGGAKSSDPNALLAKLMEMLKNSEGDGGKPNNFSLDVGNAGNAGATGKGKAKDEEDEETGNAGGAGGAGGAAEDEEAGNAGGAGGAGGGKCGG